MTTIPISLLSFLCFPNIEKKIGTHVSKVLKIVIDQSEYKPPNLTHTQKNIKVNVMYVLFRMSI